MSIRLVRSFLLEHWGPLLLSAILGLIIVLSLKPGFVILGNDNFTPELNPGLSFERSLFAPGWRAYRVLGIPSDSESADLFRQMLYVIVSPILPTWAISQGYLFFTFFIGSFTTASFVSHLLRRYITVDRNITFLFGGLLYLCSMLTSWIYFFPAHLFVAAYAFLPFVLWRLILFFEHASAKNAALLLLASLLLSTAGLTATMFFVCAVVIIVFALLYGQERKRVSMALFITLAIHLYWILPFVTYAYSNTKVITQSAITRDITASAIENEIKHNTALNSLRYFASWMDTKENNKDYTFSYRQWYKESVIATLLSFIPLILAIIGTFWTFKRRIKPLYIVPLLAVAGWFLIKGVNPPLGFIYALLQDNFSVFVQVFRWQSSKMWPLLSSTLPILGVLGITVVFGSLRQKYGKKAAVGFLALVALGLLGFVYPYFKGDMVRSQVYTKVPIEYYSLASFLEKTDTVGRIYLAPEANTLYFRNYSWGFWGSVVWHYLIKNPLIEKALVIGSKENEDAFTVIKNAYYSENPTTFTTVLKLYDAEYVLSDKYSFAGNTGYSYNWEVHKKVVEENPLLEKVWEEGKLALYKLSKDEGQNIDLESVDLETVYSKSDPLKLNTIRVAQHNTQPYLLDSTQTGTIYPFALNFDKLEFKPSEIVAQAAYTQPKAVYEFTINKEQFDASPTQVTYNAYSREVMLLPLLPSFTVNNKTHVFTVPSKTYVLEKPALFISVDDQVIDSTGTSGIQGSTTPYFYVDQFVTPKSWIGTFEPLDLLAKSPNVLFFCNDSEITFSVPIKAKQQKKCGSREISMQKDAIVEFEIRIKTTKPIHALLCIESQYRHTCLNRNSSAFITQDIGDTTMLVPIVLYKGESIKVFLDLEALDEDALVSLEKLTLKLYQENVAGRFVSQKEVETDQSFFIELNPQDNMALHIPLLQGPNSAPLKSDAIFIPQASTLAFDEKVSKSSITISKDKGLEMVNTESNSSIFPKLMFLDPGEGLSFVGVEAQNLSGIPLELSFRDISKPYKLWTRKIWYRTKTHEFELFLMPNAVESYYFEGFSTALGPRPSINRVNALIYQIIPKSWYSMRLIAVQPELSATQLSTAQRRETNTYIGVADTPVVTLPTAYSPYWNLTVANKRQNRRVLVNGWKQGFVADSQGTAQAVYLPNILFYLGFFPLIIVGMWIVGKAFQSESFQKALRLPFVAKD